VGGLGTVEPPPCLLNVARERFGVCDWRAQRGYVTLRDNTTAMLSRTN